MNYLKMLPFGISYYLRIVWRVALLLLLYALSRYVFFLYHHDLMGALSWGRLWLIFKGGFRFDLSAVLYLNALWLFLALLPFRRISQQGIQRWLKVLFVSVNAIAFAVNTMDFYYFRFTLRRTDSSVFTEFQGQTHIGKIIWESIWQQWPLLLFWMGLVVLLIVGYGKVRRRLLVPQPWYFYATRCLTLLLTVPLIIIGMRGGVDRTTRPIAMSHAGAYIREPIEAGMVLNTPFCLIRSIGQRGLERIAFFDSEEELDAVYSPIHTPEAKAYKNYNVVIFILESFAKPHIIGFTPFLDSLMAQGYACVNAYANGRKSIDAMPSVLGSIPSLTYPFVLLPYSLNRMDGLGSVLGQKGYHTSFFHGAPNGSMGFDAIAKMLGFEHYYGKTEYNRDSDYDGFWGIWDEPFLQFFAQTLDSFPQPFVSAIFTVSSHHPFVLPEKYKGVFPKGPEPVQECIGYTDMALRLFFERAATEPWFDNTLFVFTADHSLWSESVPEYQNSLGSTAIPILYYFPGVIEPQMDTQPTQQIDVMPTILSYLGYDQPFFSFGRSLLDTLYKPFAVNYTGNYQLLRDDELLLFDGNGPVGSMEYKEENLTFLKAFIQHYNNRLLDDRLTVE